MDTYMDTRDTVSQFVLLVVVLIILYAVYRFLSGLIERIPHRTWMV